MSNDETIIGVDTSKKRCKLPDGVWIGVGRINSGYRGVGCKAMTGCGLNWYWNEGEEAFMLDAD